MNSFPSTPRRLRANTSNPDPMIFKLMGGALLLVVWVIAALSPARSFAQETFARSLWRDDVAPAPADPGWQRQWSIREIRSQRRTCSYSRRRADYHDDYERHGAILRRRSGIGSLGAYRGRRRRADRLPGRHRRCLFCRPA